MPDSPIKNDASNSKWGGVAKMAEHETAASNEALSEDLSLENSQETTVNAEKTIEDTAFLALQSLLQQTEEKADENWQKYLLAHAEMDNLRRRTEQDIANAHKYALEKFARDILAVMDSMENAVNTKIAENEQPVDALLKSMRDGVMLTHRLLLTTLEKYGITVVDPLGEKFNPDLHQAMSMQENKEVPNNTVVLVLQKGYCLQGRLLRPALVVIAN